MFFSAFLHTMPKNNQTYYFFDNATELMRFLCKLILFRWAEIQYSVVLDNSEQLHLVAVDNTEYTSK